VQRSRIGGNRLAILFQDKVFLRSVLPSFFQKSGTIKLDHRESATHPLFFAYFLFS
jgi:hypothetical protein